MRVDGIAGALCALFVVFGAASARAQDEPAGGNAMSGSRYDETHGGVSEVTVGMPYLEIRGWPQGSRRPMPQHQILSRSRIILADAGSTCDIVEAYHPGDTRGRDPIFEVRCAAGPGFLITAGDTPEVYNCLLLDAQEQARREREPGGDPQNLCLLEGSRDAVAVLKPLVEATGTACEVDEALWIGRIDGVGDRYEIGCAGRAGIWLETAINGATVTGTWDCLEVARSGQTCRFTTADEATASVAALLPSSGAPPCDPTAGRLVGVAASGERYYELKCRETSGFIFRAGPDGVWDQAWPCAQATGIIGGCRL